MAGSSLARNLLAGHVQQAGLGLVGRCRGHRNHDQLRFSPAAETEPRYCQARSGPAAGIPKVAGEPTVAGERRSNRTGSDGSWDAPAGQPPTDAKLAKDHGLLANDADKLAKGDDVLAGEKRKTLPENESLKAADAQDREAKPGAGIVRHVEADRLKEDVALTRRQAADKLALKEGESPARPMGETVPAEPAKDSLQKMAEAGKAAEQLPRIAEKPSEGLAFSAPKAPLAAAAPADKPAAGPVADKGGDLKNKLAVRDGTAFRGKSGGEAAKERRANDEPDAVAGGVRPFGRKEGHAAHRIACRFQTGAGRRTHARPKSNGITQAECSGIVARISPAGRRNARGPGGEGPGALQGRGL